MKICIIDAYSSAYQNVIADSDFFFTHNRGGADADGISNAQLRGAADKENTALHPAYGITQNGVVENKLVAHGKKTMPINQQYRYSATANALEALPMRPKQEATEQSSTDHT